MYKVFTRTNTNKFTYICMIISHFCYTTLTTIKISHMNRILTFKFHKHWRLLVMGASTSNFEFKKSM